MPFGHNSKILAIRLGMPSARPGVGGGPMVNPRAPGFRAGLAFPMHSYQWGSPGFGRFGGQGDPGIFGAIGKALGGVVKGVAKSVFNATPVGMAYNAVTSALSPGRIGAPTSRTSVSGLMPMPPAPTGGMWQPPVPLSQSYSADEAVYAGTAGKSGPGTAVATRPGCAPAGYHFNKHGYWKNNSNMLPGASWQEPGSVLVKNRRVNPFNPRAASRAMRRLEGLAKGMKGLKKEIGKVARAAGVQHHTPRRAFRRKAG